MPHVDKFSNLQHLQVAPRVSSPLGGTHVLGMSPVVSATPISQLRALPVCQTLCAACTQSTCLRVSALPDLGCMRDPVQGQGSKETIGLEATAPENQVFLLGQRSLRE